MALTQRQINIMRRVVTAAMVLALLSPLIRNQDGLPLSTYPMYAGTRSEVLEVVVAYGVRDDGSRAELSMPEIAKTRDPLIAQSFLNDEVAAGSVEALCSEIAGRVPDELAGVEIARERRNVVEQVRGRRALLDQVVLASCEVLR